MRSRGFAALPILVLVALVITAGAYIALRNRAEAPSTSQERVVEEITTQSTSDEPEAIEADLEATSYTEIDSDLQQIEAELDAALQTN